MATEKQTDGRVSVTKSQYEKYKKLFEQAILAQYEASSAIKREGKQLVIPEHMEVKDAIKALQDYLDRMESRVETVVEIVCHVDDGLVCLTRALKREFGNIVGDSIVGFFTFIPGQVSVQVSYDESETAFSGEIKIPGLDEVSLLIKTRDNDKNPMSGTVAFLATYPRKYEPLIKDIEKLWRLELHERSIFKNRAIDSRFTFINLRGADTAKLVYSEHEQRMLDANVFSAIQRTADYIHAGIPIKRTVLLRGRFGTGKTLTALRAAQVSVENGWTFINVRPGDSIENALNFARRYQPCLVFFEDIDSVVGGERSAQLNAILNTIDGLLSKDAKVLTILTTNRSDHINPAMLRPGRIDAVIDLGMLNESSIARMVKTYGGNLIEGDISGAQLLSVAADYVPAFVADAVHRAKMYALANGQHDGQLRITQDNVYDALVELRPQFDMMMGKQTIAAPSLDQVFGNLVKSSVKATVLETLEDSVIKDNGDDQESEE